jgi:tetratricopeptide (TPR) repeat protein
MCTLQLMAGAKAKRLGFLMVVTLLAAGCGQFASSTGDLDRDPTYLQARKAADSGDFHVAAQLYDQVLRHFPDAAKAHLELGLLYDEKLSDPIAAIYHYNQCLQLDPNTDRRQVVQGYIEHAQLALSAKLPPSSAADPGELVRLQTEKSALMQENAALRTRVAELEHASTPSAGMVAGAGADAPVPPPTSPPAATQVVAQAERPAPPPPRMHLVQKGDTLQSIALHYYGTRSGWEKIFAANRAVLPSKDQLKIGQQLLIP